MTRNRINKNTLVTVRHDAVYISHQSPTCTYWKPSKVSPSTSEGHITYMILGLLGQTMSRGTLKELITEFVATAPTTGTRGGSEDNYGNTADRVICYMKKHGLILTH